MEGLTVASGEEESTADGNGGGGGGGSRGVVREETRRCNAHRAARPPMLMFETRRGRSDGGGGGRGRINKPQQQRHHLQQQQQQQQQQLQHGGGKKQKKQQKWKANKYRGGGRGGGGGGPERKDCVVRGGRKDKSAQGGGLAQGGTEDGTAPNGVSGDDSLNAAVPPGATSGELQQSQSEPGCFHQVQQLQHGISTAAGTATQQQQQQQQHQQQQSSGSHTSSGGGPGQQAPGAATMSGAIPPQQKGGKHPKQQNLTPMEVRNKRLQSVSKFFLPDKRPRKECIVPPTKFLLGGNISDPLNLNSLQNESENAVTPKSSPIPTPPHYKAKVEVLIPPNINDPLHLLDPVDSVEYEMQLCSPMKRKQRPRNKRKRKSRTAGATERGVDGSGGSVTVEQLPPPPPGAVDALGSSGSGGVGGAADAEQATTAEEASFTGIGQRIADAAAAAAAAASERYALRSDPESGSHLQLAPAGGQLQASGSVVTSNSNSLAQPGVGAVGGGPVVVVNTIGAGTLSEQQEREREKAMRNLKLDLESAGGGGRKRRTSESTNSTKNKLRRMDSMDKIVSPVIPQPGGWKRAHWPPNSGGGGAAGSAGRNRTRTYSTTSNTEEAHGAGGDDGTGTGAADVQAQDKALFCERLDALMGGGQPCGATTGAAAQERPAEEKPLLADETCVGAVSVERPVALREGGRGEGVPEGGELMPRPQTALAASGRYHYGNYDRYYGYHSLNEFIDVRLKVFLRNVYLFRDKDVLDIGCNVGLMTIAVAKLLHTKTATGIDVDGKLVAKARKNLAKYVRMPRSGGGGGGGGTGVKTVVGGRQGNRHNTAAAVATSSGKEETMMPGAIVAPLPFQCDPLQLTRSEPCATSQMDEDDEAGEPVDESVLETSEIAEPPVGGTGAPVEETHGPESAANSPTAPAAGKFLAQQKRRRKRQTIAQKRRGSHYHQHHHHQHHHQQHNHQLRRSKAEQSQYFPISFPLTMGNLSGKQYLMDIGRPEHKFPHNVRFKTMNYVVKDESLINYDTQQYDLILCLSVTKWIHLNYGDAGLKIAFKRMFNHLRPGGKLILEAQNWASYKKKKKLTETTFENYKNIEFFPNRFHDYLLSPEVGFSHSFPLGIPRHLNKGFRRPIQLYIKGDFTPSQAKWSDTYHPGTPYENHRGIYTDIITASQSAAGCIWGAMTPYAPSYSYRQPPTPSHGGGAGTGGSGSGSGFASTSPYYNPRQTDSYLPSYDNIGSGYRPGSYCFASPLYSTTWSPPSDMVATSGGGGGSYRRSASNTPNSGSFELRGTDNDEHYYAAGGGGGGSQRRHHVYPPTNVFPPMPWYDAGIRSGGGGGFRSGGVGGGAMTDSDSEPSSNSASQTPTRQQQLAGSFLTDDQSNSPSGHSQPDK